MQDEKKWLFFSEIYWTAYLNMLHVVGSMQLNTAAKGNSCMSQSTMQVKHAAQLAEKGHSASIDSEEQIGYLFHDFFVKFCLSIFHHCYQLAFDCRHGDTIFRAWLGKSGRGAAFQSKDQGGGFYRSNHRCKDPDPTSISISGFRTPSRCYQGTQKTFTGEFNSPREVGWGQYYQLQIFSRELRRSIVS